MKILMLNDYMDSPTAHWRGAQVQTRRLAKVLGASVNGKVDCNYPPKSKWDTALVYPDGGWDVVNYQDNRSLISRFSFSTRTKIYVVTARHFDPAPDLEIIDRYNEMDGIIANCYYVKDELVKKGVIEKKIRVIPSCIEVFEAPLKYAKTSTFAITFAGAVEKRKGIETLVEAMRLMSSRKSKYWIPGVSLLVIGAGRDFDWMKEIALKENLPIFFHGLLPIKEMREVISHSDVFVLPSIQEAFGSVLLEAMMVETPIIASAVGGIPEVVQHGRDGILVPGGDVEELAKKLWMMATLELRMFNDMAARAKRKVLNYYTVDRVARLTKEYYQELPEVKNG